MSEQTSQALERAHTQPVTEYVPFGAQDKLKLSVSIVKRLIAVPTRSGKMCSDEDALRFIAMCQAGRHNPFAGDAYLIGYDSKDGPKFNLILAHQSFLKRAELHPEYDGMQSGIIISKDGDVVEIEGDFYLPGQEVVGGWARVFFKSRQHPMYKRCRMERFRKPFGVWVDDAAGMICKCAEADALRSAFPTSLGGMYLREELAVGMGGDGVLPEKEPTDERPRFLNAVTPTEPAAPPETTQEAPGQPETTQRAQTPMAGRQKPVQAKLEATAVDLAAFVSEVEPIREKMRDYMIAKGILLATEDIEDCPLDKVPTGEQVHNVIERCLAWAKEATPEPSVEAVAFQPPEGAKSVMGFVRMVKEKATAKGGTNYSILLVEHADDREGGDWIGTFDDVDGSAAKTLEGSQATAWWTPDKTGKFKNLCHRGIFPA